RTGPGRGRPEGGAMKPAATVARDAHQNSVTHDDRGVPVSMTVNGRVRTLTVEPRTTLLDALRDELGLTGTKKACDRGECGACTVHVDGRRVLSCMTLAVMQDGKRITTIEGLERDGNLHAMQSAFIEHDGFQCGFCTSGQICSALAMLQEVRGGMPSAATAAGHHRLADPQAELTDDEIRERMAGNICRCGAYPNIMAANRAVEQGQLRTMR